MTTAPYRALVVDDEPMLRDLTARALTAEGFDCDTAGDGLEAGQMIGRNQYDAIITDLQMPNKNGHAFAAEVLRSEDRPIVAVLTGILEPRLARDLIARGADQVDFKPTNSRLLAAKVRALVSRRRGGAGSPPSEEVGAGCELCDTGTSPDHASDERANFSLYELDHKITHLSKVLPVSQAAFDVYSMTSSAACDTAQVAAAIARDASLSADVLRLVNSSFYSASDKKVMELEEAVVRIGHKRIGELALATSALGALSCNVLPWMDLDLAWRRSVSAGVAMDYLLANGQLGSAGEGLFLTAIMHCLGRIASGMLYPQQYAEMAALCKIEGDSLLDREIRTFRVGQGQVAARLLQAWSIPPDIYEPLKYLTDSYARVTRLAEPLRDKVSLLKLAVLVGRLTTGAWEVWDRVEVPSGAMMERLGIESVPETIESVRSDAKEIINFRSRLDEGQSTRTQNPRADRPMHEVYYYNLSPEPFDMLAEILPSMGLSLRAPEGSLRECEHPVVVNCLWTPATRIAAQVNPRQPTTERIILSDSDNLEVHKRYGQALSLPASYGAIASACRQAAQPLSPGNPDVP